MNYVSTALGVAMLIGTPIIPWAEGQNRSDSPSWRLLDASEIEQIAAVRETLDRGFPGNNSIGLLMMNKPALVLPLIEKKIEEVLRSPSPRDCFTDKTVDPRRFVITAAAGIADTGSEHALAEIAKLIRLDEQTFGSLVELTLISAETYAKSHNPFIVAYRGLDRGDPGVNRRIHEWIDTSLSVDPEERARAEAAARGYGPVPPPPAEKMKRLWAQAMIERDGGVPTESQWRDDPIASKLREPLAESLHREMPQLATEAVAKRK